MILTAAELASVALISGATLAGAWLGRRAARLRSVSLMCTAAILVIVVAADLSPDVLADLRATGLPWWVAVIALAAGLLGTDVLVRRGCACSTGRATGGRATGGRATGARATGGRATAVALGV